MKSGLTMFFCLCGVVAFATVCRANVSDAPATGADQNQTDAAAPTGQEPYSPIWERNVFNLTPKPPLVDPNSIESNQPPSNIKLIGITTIFGNTAILSMQEQPERGKQGNKEEYLTMKEGERHGALEVMEIHPDSRTVKIKNDQIVSTITFETNKAPASMAGAPHPPMGGFGAGFQPPRMGIPMNNGAPAPLPNRMMRSTPNGPSASAGQPNYGGANLGATGYGSGYQPAGVGAGGVNLNSLFGQAPPPINQQAQSPGLSAEEQAAVMAASQAGHTEDIAAGKWPPLPTFPTGVDNGSGTGNGQNGNNSTGQNTGSQLPPWLQNRSIPNFKPPAP